MNAGIPNDASVVTIRIFTTHEAADVAVANLEAHGIECWVVAADAGGMLPSLTAPGGVRLAVKVSDSTLAKELLEDAVAVEESPALSDTEFETHPRPAPSAPSIPRPVWAVGMVVIGVLVCLFFQWVSREGTTHTRYHYAADGAVDEAWVYKAGSLVQFMKDRNHDGKWDRWAYYSNGRIERAEADNNFDGKPDQFWFFSNGDIVRMEADTDFNGTPDMFCTYKDGMVEQVDYKPNGSLFVTERRHYKNDVLVDIQRGGYFRGNFKETVRYDPFGNPVSTNSAR